MAKFKRDKNDLAARGRISGLKIKDRILRVGQMGGIVESMLFADHASDKNCHFLDPVLMQAFVLPFRKEVLF